MFYFYQSLIAGLNSKFAGSRKTNSGVEPFRVANSKSSWKATIAKNQEKSFQFFTILSFSIWGGHLLPGQDRSDILHSSNYY
jgi:hypothetical protein